MEITVFAKKRTSSDGKPFTSYLARLIKKTGEAITCKVKFREECGQPKAEECPLNITFDKRDANIDSKVYQKEDTGEDAISYTLWVSAWKRSENVYEDHSLDDFE